MMDAKTMEQPASAYFLEDRHDPNETHTLSVLVQNEPGVLARVICLFSGRGYNIDSLTVTETEHEKHLSRITIIMGRTLGGATEGGNLAYFTIACRLLEYLYACIGGARSSQPTRFEGLNGKQDGDGDGDSLGKDQPETAHNCVFRR